MTSVGEILRSAREQQGRAMSEIAEELCITQRYLRAIEHDDLKSLPGIFFYKSFAKQYAAIIGVPEKQIQAGIDQLTSQEEEPHLPGEVLRVPEFAEPSARWKKLLTGSKGRIGPPPVREPDAIVQTGNRDYFTDRSMGAPLAGLALVVLGCSGFYAWWVRAPQVHKTAAAPEAPVSAVALPVVSQPHPTIEVTAQSSEDDPSEVVLNLSATERTWLSITSDGKEIFSGILQPSQTKTLTGKDVAKMKVGNAGGIEIKWNGKEIGPIGERGQVKTILFTKDNFQIIESPPPASNDSGETL